ncbi:MAG: glucoamylase family protein [Acidobacteriaceae bacterium]|jgi:cyclic beta-1,2-glucan synthetase
MTETVSGSGQALTIPPGHSYSAESLRSYADRVAPGWHVAHKPEGAGSFGRRIDATAQSLDQLYVILDARPVPTYLPGEKLDPLLELRQNPRLLRSVVIEVSTIRKKLGRLPRTVRDQENDEPRIVTVADAYLQATGSEYHAHAIKIFIDQVQQYDALELNELWALAPVLKFLLLEEIIVQANEVLQDEASHTEAGAELLKTRMRSLRDIGYADWFTLIEPLVVYDPVLQQDPANAYRFMDFDSRESYRKRVAEIARYSDCTELEVAQAALTLALESREKHRVEDPRLRTRRAHVGYYIIDRGFPQLASRVGYRPRFIDRLRQSIWNNADDFYIGGIQIITVVLIGLILAPLVPTYPIFGGLTLAFLLLLLPVTQGAVDLVNNTVTAIFKAYALPKLDFSKGVPEPFTTLVVIPTLLMKEKQVRELFDDLEVRYLANQDRNIHFGLLTDLPDSVTRPRQNDTDPLVELAIQLTDELNERYANAGAGSFFLLHRHRIFNARQGVWMGWERKRGKLLDLNKLLKGQFDPFPVKAGNLSALTHAQYVITLDSDTQLPRGTAHSMIGAMAHPLNRAVIDPELRIVTEGYGILQPRVGVSVQSASRSRMASIYSGQTGFDIYTRAISDAYQDLYGEGIFTGKGIYEINALHAVLDRRFPRNSLLSHDLIEGSYARVGLTTDIEVIDDYPSHYSAYTRRKHRWLRGDWQIAQWLFSKVPDESGRYVRNPIATISRWKIFDNLRRSLVETSTFALLLAGWLGLPGGALYWTAFTLFLMFVPTLVQLVFSVGRAYVTKLPGAMRDAVSGFGQGTFIALLTLVYLPHQTLLALDAIIRSLVRSFITGQRLLEWETAAEAETSAKSRTPVDRYLLMSPLVALIVGVLVFLRHPQSLLVALPILILWAFAGGITAWLNNSPQQTRPQLTSEEDTFLRQLALKTWRYFNQFGVEGHNYLIPDNVEEEGLFEAGRVSPTNFGLLLNARQAAHTFGYLTVPEFVELTEHSLQTYDKLEKFRGHIYNWYDTRTLDPIRPITISSVDSGNLAASFYTLRTGCRGMLRQPLLDPSLFSGIRDHWQLLTGLPDAPAGLKALAPPALNASAEVWVGWALATAEAPEFSVPATGEASWWLAETQRRIRAMVTIVRDYMPWLLPQFAPLFALPQLQGMAETAAAVQTGAASGLAADLDARIARASSSLASDSPLVVLAEELRLALASAREGLKALANELKDLSSESMRFATEMDFGFLMDKSRLLLSIGYEIERQHLHQACYDLLCSEARIAAFITVAKGEAPQQSWFKLGRIHTMAYGQPVLISWTGTMFEYMMPNIWMRSYPDTLVSRTLSGVVAIQRAFGKEHGIPWGISESGWAGMDDHGHYHYQAFGIPQIALKWDAVAGPVVSPYSTCLALGIEPVEALRNLKRMAKMGWTGAYGFYEAADYQESTKTPKLVREWMAHHQGMSLLAVLNLLYDNIVQDWFHANAHLEATQLLLHEKPMHEAALRAEFQAAQPRKKAS